MSLSDFKSDSCKVYPVVDFIKGRDKLCPFDFTAANTELNPEIFGDTALFSGWVEKKLHVGNCLYGIGGYNEHRTIYSRSGHFNASGEPRRLHLGADIWGMEGTKVYNPLDAVVHSFKFNDAFGDYGPTIILEHELAGQRFFSLYGHLSLDSLDGLYKGMFIPAGRQFATFGSSSVNGGWPPHLHFQLIFDMQGNEGDYPGVCRFSEREMYLLNCPDPGMILRHTFE